MTATYGVIGDVHGASKAFDGAMSYALKNFDRVVLLGDYVDKGPDSRGVLERLWEARQEHGERVIALRGNHEHELLRFLDGGDLARFVRHGGVSTLASYTDPLLGDTVRRFIAEFPTHHRLLIENLPGFHMADDYLLAHVGFDPDDPEDRSATATHLGSFPHLFRHDGPWPAKLTIAGHYLQSSGMPFLSERFAAVDTGSGTFAEAPLTVLSLPDRTIRQFGQN